MLWFYYENDLQSDIFREMKHPILSRYLVSEFEQGLINLRVEIRAVLKDFVDVRLRESATLIAERRAERRHNIIGALQFGDRPNPLCEWPWLTLTATRKRLDLIYGGGEWPEPDIRTFRHILLLAKHEVESWGGRLLFVVLPSWDNIVARARRKSPYLDAARSTARTMGLPVIDLEPVFSSHPDPQSLWPARATGHYNEAGHALVAETVLRELEMIDN